MNPTMPVPTAGIVKDLLDCQLEFGMGIGTRRVLVVVIPGRTSQASDLEEKMQ